MDQQQPKATPYKPYQPKATPTQWAEIKLRAEQGEPYEDIAKLYPISVSSIEKKASVERWATPARIQRAVKGLLPPDDPAIPAANVWLQRKEDLRESTFNGAKKALDRFFAMSPVPQSFSEAALAHKLAKEAISPPEEAQPNQNISLAILTQVGFQPTIED